MALRALVIGLGRRGREWAKEIEGDPGWQLVGAVEIDPDAITQAGETLDPSRVYGTTAEAVTKANPDAALVVTPAELHVEPATQLIEMGIPLIIEKPLATTLGEARTLVDLARDRGVPLMVAMNHRFLRSHRTVKKVLEEESLGTINLVTAQYLRPPHDMAPSLARMEHQVLWGMAIHHFDALRYVLGREATGVFARSFTGPWNQDVPRGASLQVILEFEGGIRVAYSATYESSGHGFFGAGQEFYERITGEKATLHVFHRWLFVSEGRKLPRPIRRGKREKSEERILLEKFASALRNGTEPECSGEDNLRTMAIAEACLRSVKENRWLDPRELIDAR